MENQAVPVSDGRTPVDEPLSPELVLVLPPEERAAAIARLGPPVWPKAALRRAPPPPAPPPEPAPSDQVEIEPEPVLVLPLGERVDVIARRGLPVLRQAVPRPLSRPPEPEPAPGDEVEIEDDEEEESFARAVASLVAARLVSLTLLFTVVTVLTLVLSLVASATR